MRIKGTVIQEFEADREDILMAAFMIHKESVGREDWALIGKDWLKSEKSFPYGVLRELATPDEIEKDEFFDNLFKFARGEM